jgi:NodT family efflux transporter outer membrane factor (OMF) lipoprotein
MTKNQYRALFLALPLWLMGCAAGPDYVKPPVDTPAAYKESGDWKEAMPQPADARTDVWQAAFHDSVLDALLREAAGENQSIKASEAAWAEARAVVAETNAALFPTVALDATSTRSGLADGKKTATTTHKLSLGASWEPDLWGSTRRAIEGDTANLQAAEADLAAKKLSVQSSVATAYFNLRAADALKDLLQATVKGYERSLQIADNQYRVGLAALADVTSARTQLLSAKASLIAADVARTKNEHALAALLGKAPAAFALASMPLAGDAPMVPATLPSFLLERRPDIASAERAVASANAAIGVKTAAYFPTVTLSGAFGYAASAFGKLLQGPSSVWSFGPALAETLFDAGAREARVDQARAAYDQSVATYRQTVLSAFQEVEDNLANQRIYAEQAKAEALALEQARTAEKLALNQYEAGTVPYSSVVTAQVARLQAEEAALTVRQNQYLTATALIAALGGGWTGLTNGE